MTEDRKILSKTTDTYSNETTVLDLDDSKILPFGEPQPEKTKFEKWLQKTGSYEEYLLNRHSPLYCYRTIFQQIEIEWDREYPRLAVWWLLREDYPVMLEKLQVQPTADEFKSAIKNAIEFIDSKTGGDRDDELLQAMKFYAVGVILGEYKKHKADALNYLQRSKDIWSQYRKEDELI